MARPGGQGDSDRVAAGEQRVRGGVRGVAAREEKQVELGQFGGKEILDSADLREVSMMRPVRVTVMGCREYCIIVYYIVHSTCTKYVTLFGFDAHCQRYAQQREWLQTPKIVD